MGHISGSAYCRIGDAAVEACIPLLQEIAINRIVKSPEGSRIEKQLQQLGVDLILWDFKDRLICVEIKGASETYESIFAEVVADSYRGIPGWMHTVQSDYLVYTYLDTGQTYMMEFEPFHEWFMAKCTTYPVVTQTRYETKRHTIGIKIPWVDIHRGIGECSFGSFNLEDDHTVWMDQFYRMGLTEIPF